MQEEKKKYKPGFWCSFFWVVTWLGMLTGIVVLFFTVNNALRIMIWSWSIAGVSAVISYLIRTIEKSSFDGHWSWHWFD